MNQLNGYYCHCGQFVYTYSYGHVCVTFPWNQWQQWTSPNTIQYAPVATNKGWECPKCGKGFAPTEKCCDSCGKKEASK